MPSAYHLAQINVARMIAPIDSPLLRDFAAQLATINALADRAPGFIWRLESPTGQSTVSAVQDPQVLVNMSVWESFESLHAYTYKSAHAAVMHDRKRWFTKYEGPYYALWWLPCWQIPTVDEGFERIRRLGQHGPSRDAFWFGSPFSPPDAGERPAP